MSRYYSNTFADYDKQNALNIFLGVYRPSTNLGRVNLWDLPTDYWLHNSVAHPFLDDYCSWFDLTDDFLAQKYVPYRSLTSNITLPTNEMSDYDLYYRTYEISSFDVLLNSTSRIANVESLMPNTSNAPIQQTKPFWKRSQVSIGLCFIYTFYYAKKYFFHLFCGLRNFPIQNLSVCLNFVLIPLRSFFKITAVDFFQFT